MVPFCRALALSVAFTSALARERVDTHIHALPPPYIEALEAAGGDPSGFPTPQWTLEATLRSMDLANTQVAILSLSTPGIPIAGTGEAARSLTRTMNEYFGNATSLPKHTARLGFFGVLPDWRDVNGTLAELDYLYSEQKLCNGVTAYTTYGDRLLGDPLFAPVWDRLQRYKALVFVHPGTLTVAPKFIASSLAQPIVDYPLATTRTAVDLVMTQTMRRCPDVDVILSHAGGAVPFLAGRAIGGLALPEIADAVGYNALGAAKDFARFYYDIALSTSAAQLHGLLDFADASHILFGSDFPYVPQAAISTLLAQYATFVTTDARGPLVSPARLRENSLKLLNRHALGKAF
ncbi:uncharacterized protein B0I36DRAFT_291733 [Microdochium trichocladiopsis]|uniref:6-methylsalicylate decarboxylase n=1 Tax=Microdochium trichocladiopsis TaxID=1682393 RepID=A0A9P9BQ51_9PEZI|nr:uncharacterized protein B0I36DRAFT_291733 [Microdochium trichocladiopsis]KAH7029922.1 hypothetical protein B0I36DRAFT_291733 [Microdochium trichocladiopsis]